MAQAIRTSARTATTTSSVVGHLMQDYSREDLSAVKGLSVIINFFRKTEEDGAGVIVDPKTGAKYARTPLHLSVEAAWSLRTILDELLDGMAGPVVECPECGGKMIEIGPGNGPRTDYHCVDCEHEVPMYP